MKNQIKAFVSSTFEDLKDHRACVIQALRNAGIYVDPMENWTADSNEPKKFSQERVKGCDLCILLVAFRRGFIPEWESLSITQMEYQYALSLGVDVLLFLLDDDAPWPRRFDDMDKEPGIAKWRDELKSRHGASFFGHEPDSLKIEPAISRWLRDKSTTGVPAQTTPRGLSIDDLRVHARKNSDNYLEKMQNERVYLPHLYARRIELEAHLLGFLDQQCTKNGMLIVGTSGIGKTNTLCHIVKQWRDDPSRLKNDIVWLVGGITLPGGNFSLRDVMLDCLDITGSFGAFLANFDTQRKATNARLIIMVDGADKHPQPNELLHQIDALIVRNEQYPWLKVITSIGEVVFSSLRKSGLALAARYYYTVTTKELNMVRESTEVSLGRMTDEELAEAYGKYILEPGMAPTSAFESLSADVKSAINNPLFLRVVMEVFDGRKIPRRVLTSEVLLEYCNKKVFSDPNREYFINRFVDHLFTNKIMAASFDSLAQISDLRQFVLDSSPQSAYLQLLDEQVLEVQHKRVSSILPPHRTVAFTYDRLLEYLLIKRIVEQDGIVADTIVRLSEQACEYTPLRGVLTTLILTKAEEGAFNEVASLLLAGNKDVMTTIAIDIIVELEQRSPPRIGNIDREFSQSAAGKVVVLLLADSSESVVSLLVKIGNSLHSIGLYRSAQFIYESLLLKLSATAMPLLMADIRLMLGNIKTIVVSKQEAVVDFEVALDLYRSAKNQPGEQAVLDAMGCAFLDMGDLNLAEKYFEQSLIIDRELVARSPATDAYKGEAHSLLNLSDICSVKEKLGRAMELAENARQIYEQKGDQRGLAIALDKVGLLNSRLGYYEKSKAYHMQALQIHQQFGDKRGAAQAYCFIGITKHGECMWAEAHAYYQKAMVIYTEIEDKNGMAYTQLNVGETYRWQGDFQNALGCYNTALELYKELGEKVRYSYCKSNIGATYLFLGDFDKGISWLEEAVHLEEEIAGHGDPETLAYLSASLLRKGDHMKALAASDLAVALLPEMPYSEEEVPLVYYYRFKILEAMSKLPEANEALDQAYREIMKQAKLRQDLSAQDRFLGMFPLRRDIIVEWKQQHESK